MYHFLVPINVLITLVSMYLWTFMSNEWLGNVFLAIMEDGFIISKRKPLNRWIKADIEDPVGLDIDFEGHEGLEDHLTMKFQAI